ncbi:glyoxylate/hydroxypyruvate reductase A [soil metagenome]
METVAIVSSIDLSGLVPHLQARLPQLKVATWPHLDEASVTAAVCWHPPHGVLARFKSLRFIQSVGAGVDHIASDDVLPQVPLCRVVDDAQSVGIGEYVHWAALYYQCAFDQAALQQSRQSWKQCQRVAASAFTVGVLGLGEIGRVVASKLAVLGYAVRGWSRQCKTLEGVACFAGGEQLHECIGPCDLIVSLLPLTPHTSSLIDAAFLRRCKPGVAIVNCGRGRQLVLDDLRAALDDGSVRGAVLDVFDTEPLPLDHWAWRHPRVRVTPHMAGHASLHEIAVQVAANVARSKAGEALRHVVDLRRGY